LFGGEGRGRGGGVVVSKMLENRMLLLSVSTLLSLNEEERREAGNGYEIDQGMTL